MRAPRRESSGVSRAGVSGTQVERMGVLPIQCARHNGCSCSGRWSSCCAAIMASWFISEGSAYPTRTGSSDSLYDLAF